MKKQEAHITLGQFLKLKDYVNSGGEAKHLINTFSIQVNGEEDNRRGRKLYNDDVVVINGTRYTVNGINEN
ncbi:RNA-binding S4 domain-containing protein [Erysipelothrix urinaevulpis]